jgi:hypothetical protein
MEKYPLLRKGLVCGIIVLFLGMSSIPMAGSVPLDKEQSIIPKSCFDGIIINGTMGQNGWYVSPVWVILDFPGNFIYFKIDDGTWQKYTIPFVVTTDRPHTVSCYYIDNEGHHSDTYYASFKIDQTPPDWEGVVFDKIGHNYYKIYAEVSDATSGVNRVEFYLNDHLIYTDYKAPYEWFYKGPSFNPSSIVYDNAGNSAMLSHGPPDQITYFAIGFINNPQFNEFGGTFFAEFVIVIEHSFHALLPHISTLTHQQFGFYYYTGYMSENFMIVKAKSY